MGEYPERDGIAAMHVAYLPPDKLIGLSKIPRIVDMFARRLQAQERLTQEMAKAIAEETAPQGVAVMCEASRGGKKSAPPERVSIDFLNLGFGPH